MAASSGGGAATDGSINSGATPPILGAIEAHNLATYGSAQALSLPGLTPQQFEDAEYAGSGVLGLINIKKPSKRVLAHAWRATLGIVARVGRRS
jgi:hypothetical protein